MRLLAYLLAIGATAAVLGAATPLKKPHKRACPRKPLPVLLVNATTSSARTSPALSSASPSRTTSATAKASSTGLTSSAAAPSGTSTNIVYSTFLSDAAAAQLRNPARGWIYQHDVTLSNSGTYFAAGDAGWAASLGRYFIWLMVYLDKHVDGSAITPTELAGVSSMLGAVRAAGLKSVVRFAYTSDGTATVTEPTLDGIKAHISQLAPVLTDNVDVIFAVQQGFIGVWGEQYYTTHFGNEGTVSDAQWANRSAVTSALLAAVPLPAFVQARTPQYKQKFLGSSTAVTTSGTAFSSQSVARIGHFDDCFLASTTDEGTYREEAITGPDHTYIAQDSVFVPRGGESCTPSDTSLLSCSNALKMLSQESWVFLNIWNDEYTNTWKAGGCYDTIAARLGYNLRVTNVAVKAGGAGWTSLVIANTGFASVMSPYTVELLLVPQGGAGGGFKGTLPWDLRKIKGSGSLDLGQVSLSAASGGNLTAPLLAVLNIRDANSKTAGAPAFRLALANDATKAPAWANASRVNVLAGLQVTKLPTTGGSVALSSATFSLGQGGLLAWT